VTPEEAPPGHGALAPGEPIDALLVVDLRSGALLFADAAAVELFEPGDDDVALAPRRLLPQLVDLTPREFVTRVRRGAVEVEASVTIEALRPGPFSTGEAVLVRIRGTERLPPVTEDERVRRRESLLSLIVRHGFAGAQQVRALLREGVTGLGAESAILGRIENSELHVVYVADAPALVSGDAFPLSRTPAYDAVVRAGTFAVADSADDGSAGDAAIAARSYLSIAFRIGSEQWCASFISTQPRSVPFDADDWDYAEFLRDALVNAIQRAESEAQLEFKAYTDTLTGLPNREAAELRLEESLAEARRLDVVAALLFVDLDGFSDVNTAAKHDGGDAVLREVGERLRHSLRREEFIGRWGGDEFVIILLPINSQAQIESVATRIADVLSKPFVYGELSFVLGASVGVALFPADAGDAAGLRNAADAAMYRAKNDGGARIHFHDGRRAGGPHNQRSASESDSLPETGADGLPDAPVRRAEPSAEAGFLVMYDPIHYVREGEVSAAELVVRRIDPEHGLQPPGDSLPADGPGLRALDQWTLREAVADGNALAAQGFEIALDVRLAAADVGIFENLYPAGFTAGDWRRIRVAISARDAADPTPEFARFLEVCAAYDVGLVLDGFDGSLAELEAVERLAVSTLRIRYDVIERIAARPGGRASLEGTFAGARALGWRMIASGVENESQRDDVVTLGVDGVQGPYVGHAMTAVDFAAWLKARRESPPAP